LIDSHWTLAVPIGLRVAQAVSATSCTQQLEGVDYIFLDEVSMLACHEMHKINSQLAEALNVQDLPFGGINMIFSGDFAQLPPVGGSSLYSGQVGTQVDSALKPHLQEAAHGKALWHQVTTAVILRQNMRQKSQSPEDASLRTALVNMRYGACTGEDIQFLRSRIAGKRQDQPRVSSKDFRNVAIICGIHTQKDMINQLGCERFAAETGQKLMNFYSIDKWGKGADPAERQGKSKKIASKSKHKSNEIDFEDQREIWKLRHGATDGFAGKLSLCLGMPVMIRNNDATELCITKGQEGIVVGWQSSRGSFGKQVLDTLFVRLDSPPQVVQIPGLPDNVVPLVRSTKTVECIFPSDLKESVERQQVWVLPNFAMTAHAAQGKTRPFNVVHLNSCRDHMAYYTALSRSASAAGTIIIQGFDANVITRRCSGSLRQEFRELELLDDITRLKYEGELPELVNGSTRNDLIDQFKQWKGDLYVPEHTDASLRWSANDPMHLSMSSKAKGSYIPAKGSKPITRGPPSSPSEGRPSKRQKTAKPLPQSGPVFDEDGPTGIEWDGEDYSCSYDTLFTILFDIWAQNPKLWTRRLRSIDNGFLTALSKGFRHFEAEKMTLEDVRNGIRSLLHAHSPNQFPWGRRNASVGYLALTMLTPENSVASSQIRCTSCDYEEPEVDDNTKYAVFAQEAAASTSKWIAGLGYEVADPCPDCMSPMTCDISFKDTPSILTFEYPQKDMRTSHTIVFHTEDGRVPLYLRGIIYHGQSHFTARIIDPDGSVWYYDGMLGHLCQKEGPLKSFSSEGLRTCRGKILVLAIYAQK
jgi:hypothetical protein